MTQPLSDRGARVALPGTIAYKVVMYLRLQPQFTELASSVLAEAIGQSANGFGQYLAACERRGVLRKRLSNNIALWSLGDNHGLVPEPGERGQPGLEATMEVDAAAATSIFAYARSRGAAPFSCALHTDGRLAIERHGRLVLELTADERQILVKAASTGVSP